ncbi:hypothetical protein HRbin01_01268 [archaeon HR01]|nr:hypothetical protein HRbin01_01268 [archaeon HR01]
MKVWYFAYGSNLDLETMRRKVGSWYELKPAILRNYRLVFDHYSPSWSGGTADVVESEGGIVYGAAYLLDEEQLKILDRFEGVPTSYNRRKVLIEVAGEKLEAFTYVVSNPKKYVRPSEEYLSKVLKGLRRLGYGDDVVNGVRRAAMGKA